MLMKRFINQQETPTHVGTLNTYDVLNNDAFIVSKDAIAKIEEVLA